MRRWFVAAAVACCASTFAQQPIELPKISETVEVVIVNLDVIVTDRDGKHVRGLTSDDFEVLEDGRPQPITNFSEIVAAARPQRSDPETLLADPPREIVVFIDNFSLDFFHRKRVLAQLTGFFRQAVRPGDEAMIVTWNRKLSIEVPPTDDVARLDAGVESVMRQVSAGANEARMRQGFFAAPPAPGAPVAQTFGSEAERAAFMAASELSNNRQQLLSARFLAHQKMYDVRQTATAIKSVLTRMSGVAGRKILVLVSEGLELEPDRGLFEAIGDPESRQHAEAVFASYDVTLQEDVASIARTANAAGITIYSVHAAGPGRAIDVEDGGLQSSLARNASESSSVAALTMLADRTGGATTARTGAFARGFEQIAADLSNFYSIGYRAKSARKDGERKLQVRMKRRDYGVRARRGFVDRSPESEIGEQVISHLFFSSGFGGMRIGARMGEPQRERGGVKVPVELSIPVTALTFLPVGDQYAAGFSVFVAALDERENTSRLSEQKQRISFAAADLPKTSGAYYTYRFDVVADRGSRISIAVVDELSKTTGFARLQVPSSRPPR